MTSVKKKVCVFVEELPFIASPTAAALPLLNSSHVGSSCDATGAQDSDNSNARSQIKL